MSSVLDRWTGRLHTRRQLEARARQRYVWHPNAANKALLERRRRQVAYAERVVARHRAKAPEIIDLALNANWRFGPLGTPKYVTGHYSGTRRDTSTEDCVVLVTSFHHAHAARFGDGLGYHFAISCEGALLLGRPITEKGAHVGLNNTANVGVLCPGTGDDEPTAAQQETYKWLLRNAHTSALPTDHRSPVNLSKLPTYGHNSWPGHESNSCPGRFKTMYLAGA
jgi:hypothetical protein